MGIQHHTTLYNTIQHHTTPYNTIQHHTTLYNTLQHHTTPYNTIQPIHQTAHQLDYNKAYKLDCNQTISSKASNPSVGLQPIISVKLQPTHQFDCNQTYRLDCSLTY